MARALGPTSQLHAVLVGATGAIGQHVFRTVLQDPRYARVTTIGRRVVDVHASELPADADVSKLEQVVVDMDNLAADDVWDAKVGATTRDGGMRAVCFCTLGTTRGRAGGSAQGFRKVDFEYVRAAAIGAKLGGVSHFLLVTAQGAAKVWYSEARVFHALLYTRTKWDAQQATIAQGFSRTSIFQPGLLNRDAPGADHRMLESLAVRLRTRASRVV